MSLRSLLTNSIYPFWKQFLSKQNLTDLKRLNMNFRFLGINPMAMALLSCSTGMNIKMNMTAELEAKAVQK